MRRAGFTIIELVALIVVSCVVLAAIAMFLAVSRAGPSMRQLRDATQLRGNHQALTLWAGNNDDKYPLPSDIDADNTTVAEVGRAKDTTANLMSLLNFEGFITTEMLVSPKELNDNIKVFDEYEYDSPQNALDPPNAHWDPALSADFTSAAGGHISYAHLILQGKRLEQWRTTFRADEVMLANRGPEMRSVEFADGNVATHFANPATTTTKFFTEAENSPLFWSGYVAYNDNHIDFRLNVYANDQPVGDPKANPRLKLPQDDGTTLDIHDVMFADEQAPEGKDAWGKAYDANQFLGIFTTAGENREDFTAIWD